MVPPCPVDRCHLTVDVVLEARDGSLYGAHARNVEAFSASLLPQNRDSSLSAATLVKLMEDAEVVSLLCKFAHHRHQPDISSLGWGTFHKLATAVEKYKVYSAMGVCKLRMEYSVVEHPYEVLQYASATDYDALRDRAFKLCLNSHPLECFVNAKRLGVSDLINEASAHTLDLPLSTVEAAIRGEEDWQTTLLTWMIQREGLRDQKLRLLVNPPAATQHKGGAQRCDDWHVYYRAVALEFGADPNCDLKDIITIKKALLRRCTYCLKSVEVWERAIDNMTVEGMSFSEIYKMYKESDDESES
ncbi:hypothetical protein EYR40_009909 [Pleurotus pulmonarius]|nr:hypothetical protein EYR36_004062 [Pleurotus pulmonarius]KAF4581614.1 hypothetical protein EYR38_002943 [Pleurotus pulmonarius]KAF4591306.1 hypothetical protein EYR40_009909 [Pleurotus pulmonarius]